MPKIIGRDPVSVFIGAEGHICITQESYGEDACVLLEPQQAELVIQLIQEAIPTATSVFKLIIEDDAKEARR